MVAIRTLDDLPLVSGSKVLVRLDLNVPLKNGVITDDTRIQAALPTIQELLAKGCKLALCSHLGRPDGAPDPKYSLEPVGVRLAELLNGEVAFVANYTEEPAIDVVRGLETNQVALLENLRFFPGETSNQREFAQILAQGFEFYVDDAFGAVHRAHASVAAVTECFAPGHVAGGRLIEKELRYLAPLVKGAEAPYSVIMGGSKVSDKIGVILNLLQSCNHLLIGGAMAYTFLKFRGVDVGSSRVEADKLSLVEKIYANAEKRHVKIHLPVDHVCAKEFVETATAIPIDGASIPAGHMGLDIGPKTVAQYRKIILESKTVLWNGPMGVFEWPAFAQGSIGVANAMADNPFMTVIGGGDSVAAANMAGVSERMTHVSTGGGASLELLEGKYLPGLKVLAKS